MLMPVARKPSRLEETARLSSDKRPRRQDFILMVWLDAPVLTG